MWTALCVEMSDIWEIVLVFKKTSMFWGREKILWQKEGWRKFPEKHTFQGRDGYTWLRRFVAGVSLQSSGSDSKPVRVGFVVNETTLEQVFLRRHRFSPHTISQPVLLMTLSIADAIETLWRRAFFRLKLRRRGRRVVGLPKLRQTIC